MKQLKKLAVLLLTLCLALSFGLTVSACGNDKQCNHETSVICDNCGKLVLGESYFTEYAKSSLESISAGKGFKEKASFSVNVSIPEGEEYTVSYITAEGEYENLYADRFSAQAEFSCVYGFDKNYNIYVDYNLVFNETTYKSNAAIEKYVYTSAAKISNNTETLNYSYSYTYPTLSEQEQKINNLTHNSDITEKIDSDTVEVLKIVGNVVKCYENKIMTYANNVIDKNSEQINLALAKVMNELCTLSQNQNYNTFSMNNVGTQINKINALMDSNLNVAVDSLLGNGSYDKLPQTIETLLNTKLSVILNQLEEKGITIEGIANIIDEVVKAVTGEQNSSLESLTGVNIVKMVSLLDKEKTIKEILTTIYPNSEEAIQEFLTEFKTFLTENKNKDAYDLLLDLLFHVDTSTQEGQNIKNTIIQGVSVVSNFINKSLTVNLVLDKTGKFVSSEIVYNPANAKTEANALINYITSVVPSESDSGSESFPSYIMLSITQANFNCKITPAEIPEA